MDHGTKLWGAAGGVSILAQRFGEHTFFGRPPGLTKPSLTKISLIVSSLSNGTFTPQDGKTLVCDKRDRASVTCVFCRDLH